MGKYRQKRWREKTNPPLGTEQYVDADASIDTTASHADTLLLSDH